MSNERIVKHHFSEAIRTTLRLMKTADVESSIKSFLKSANNRKGGRQKRMKKTAITPAEIYVNTSSDSDSDN